MYEGLNECIKKETKLLYDKLRLLNQFIHHDIIYYIITQQLKSTLNPYHSTY